MTINAVSNETIEITEDTISIRDIIRFFIIDAILNTVVICLGTYVGMGDIPTEVMMLSSNFVALKFVFN